MADSDAASGTVRSQRDMPARAESTKHHSGPRLWNAREKVAHDADCLRGEEARERVKRELQSLEYQDGADGWDNAAKSHIRERVVRSCKGAVVQVTELRLSREMRRALRVPKDAFRGPVR